MKYFWLMLLLLYPFINLYSQKYKCPLDNGYIIVGYKNNKEEQTFKPPYFQGDIRFTPIDFTIITEDKENKVISISDSKVLYTTDELDGIIIVNDIKNKKIIRYEKIENIQVKIGDTIHIGEIIATPKPNNFPPKNTKNINKLYNINISAYSYNDKNKKIIHTPLLKEDISCNFSECDNCQPYIYY